MRLTYWSLSRGFYNKIYFWILVCSSIKDVYRKTIKGDNIYAIISSNYSIYFNMYLLFYSIGNKH